MTSTELGYLDGVTSNIQSQLNGKASTSHEHDIIKSKARAIDNIESYNPGTNKVINYFSCSQSTRVLNADGFITHYTWDDANSMHWSAQSLLNAPDNSIAQFYVRSIGGTGNTWGPWNLLVGKYLDDELWGSSFPSSPKYGQLFFKRS